MKNGKYCILIADDEKEIRDILHDWSDRDEVKSYLGKMLDGQVFDKKGLIYGMGHAVYSLSDPRSKILSRFVKQLSEEKGKEEAIRIIQKQIDRFRKGGDLSSMFPDRWLPTTFAVLPEPFTEQNGMVNSTMKIVRGKVEKAYASRIDHLYTPEGKNPVNRENIKSL